MSWSCCLARRTLTSITGNYRPLTGHHLAVQDLMSSRLLFPPKSYLSNYGPPLRESETLSNVAVKTQYNRIIITFERSVKFLSTFTGNLYDLADCQNIVVGSGSHAYEGFFFHANVPRFSETCYKVAAPPPPADPAVEAAQSNEAASNQTTREPVKSTTTRAPTTSGKTTRPNSHVPLPPNVKPRPPINGLARNYKFLVQLTIMTQFIDDYKSNTTEAYMRLDEQIKKYVSLTIWVHRGFLRVVN